MGGRQKESERESNDLGVYNTITKNILRINRNGIITIIVIKEMSQQNYHDEFNNDDLMMIIVVMEGMRAM